MTKLNKALLASTAIAFAGGLALPAAAQDASAAPAVVKSGKNMKLKLYGQITRHFGFVNDGENQQFRQGQNPNTSTRMGIDGRGKINKDWKLRTRFEFQIVGDSSLAVDGNQDGDRERFRIRHADAIFSNKRFGQIWIGRGDTATNGTSEVTLAPGIGTGHLNGSLHQAASGVVFTDDSTGAQVAGATLNDFFNGFDGGGRATRIRYDTPAFAGVQASVDYIDASSWSAALRYSGSAAGAKVKAAVGYTVIRDFQDGFADFSSQDEQTGANHQDGTDRLSGSGSIRLPMGLGVSISGAWEKRVDGPRDSAWNINPSIWYTMKASELGPTTFEYSLQYAENVTLNDDTGLAHAITVAQVFANTGTDTYLTFRFYDADRTGEDFDNIWVIGGGFRARF